MKLPSPVNGELIVISERAIELGRMFNLSDERSLFTINCGLHSGFPECCVVFHTLTYSWNPASEEFAHHYYNVGNSPQRAGHIQCPACILKGKVDPLVRKCRCWAEARILKLVDAGRYKL